MKKVAIFATALLFTALMFSSCKSVQDCPAYGQNSEVEFEEVRA
jgi:PBP1b-binding outer membrane lipoprotein LpoB